MAVLVCLILRWWADPHLDDILPTSFFFFAAVVSAWRGTLGSSLLATALGLLVARWFFVEPRHELSVPGAAGYIALGSYLVVSVLICLLFEWMRRTNRHLADAVAEAKAHEDALAAAAAERQRTREALQASEQRYRAVLDAIPQLVWTARPDGSLDYVNSQWEQYTGLRAAELFAQNWMAFVHPEDRERMASAWSQAVKDGSAPEVEFRIRGRDGGYLWFQGRAVPLRSASGEIVKWFGSCTDMTAMVEAQQALTRSRDVLERLVRERTSEVEQLKQKVEQENLYLRAKVKVHSGHSGVFGQSEAIQRVLTQVEQVAPTDATVLLMGETGTGKELLATTIHESSSRRHRVMLSVNCAALPGPLVESELFGREKGAFTGSLSRQVGRFELADQSTIFLDEIGEFSVEVQTKLLRVLENKQIERLGNPRPIPVNVRIIAATNENLEKAVAKGKFRQDLFYRLNVFPIFVPPLRERREDIPLLVWAFVDEFTRTFNKNIESIDAESMNALQRYSWPGNVRELRNLIERAMIVSKGPKLRILLPAAPAPSNTPGATKLQDVEREHVLKVLESTAWRVRGPNGAAARLGLKPTTLEARMMKLGLRRPQPGMDI